MNATVVAVAASPTHGFSKAPTAAIHLIEGLGVQGDAHNGATVKHRSRVTRDPTQPNLRQVHLLHQELFDELATKGFILEPGDIGENVLTRGIDLLGLSKGTLIHIGTARMEVTGLRNPCLQLDRFRPGLMAATLDRTPEGALIRKTGIMAVVLDPGTIRPGDPIRLTLPKTHTPLEAV